LHHFVVEVLREIEAFCAVKKIILPAMTAKFFLMTLGKNTKRQKENKKKSKSLFHKSILFTKVRKIFFSFL
jgi:hypothetical protein